MVLSFRAGTALYNLDLVLEAFAVLRRRLPDATLAMVHGDAPLTAATRAALARVGAEGSVRMLGAVAHDDMPTWFRAADVGVSVPASDGSPSSVWEALASGLPLVLSDLAQIRARIAGSGAVRMVDRRPDAIAAALDRILTDTRRRAEMARAGRTWAIANADAREQVARLGRVYSALAARPALSRARAPRPARARPSGGGRATAGSARARPS
jgi:glycosyltransferase involved in cell wall biosynthesis